MCCGTMFSVLLLQSDWQINSNWSEGFINLLCLVKIGVMLVHLWICHYKYMYDLLKKEQIYNICIYHKSWLVIFRQNQPY